jgi:hypothetical protein
LSIITELVAASGVVGVVAVVGRIIIVWLALRETKPEDRPTIITALAELFRWWRAR